MSKKVRVGEPLAFQANDWNRFVDSSKLPNDVRSQLKVVGPRFFGVLVKNTEGDTMGIGCPVKIGDVEIGDVPELSAGIDGIGYYAATFPTRVLTLPACGICVQPIGEDLFGIVAIAGVFWAKVNGSDVGNYIDTLPDSSGAYKTSWRYSDAGPHRVLSRSDTGAFVQLNQPSWQIFAKTPGGGIGAENVATCTLQRVNPSTAAVTDTSFSVPVRNKSKYAIAGNTRVNAHPIGDHFWAEDPVTRVYLDGTDFKLKYETAQTLANLVVETTDDCE